MARRATNRPRDRLVVAGALVLIVAVGLALRLRHNDYGLPYSYVADENTHFTVHAAEMFRDDANPEYFRNPSAFTYLLHGLLRLPLGGLGPLPDLGGANPFLEFLLDPSPFFETGRFLAALLCMAGVVAVFFVGSRLWGTREGIAAAAVLSVAFLPVAYSRLALTDVGTFLPISLAVFGAVRAHETGERRHYALAGAATGLAVGFKYTSGLVFLAVLAAAALSLCRRPGEWRTTLAGLAIAIVAACAAFFATTPYFFADLDFSITQLRDQARVIGGAQKFGQSQSSGFLYYLDSLGWGFGVAALVAALGGATVLVRRDRDRGLVLLIFPIVFFLYLGTQSRYFARYLLAVYPVLALLCSVGLVRVVDLVPAAPVWRRGILAAATLAVLAQPLSADIRTMELLGRQHTLQSARDFLVETYPPGTRVDFPQGATPTDRIVPTAYYLENGPRRRTRQFPEDLVKTVRGLDPGVVDRLRRSRFCLVMTTSLDRGRALIAGRRQALDYYRRLERESELVFAIDPFEPGAEPVPFHYDLSYNYHPAAYERPGPSVWIHRLRGCRAGPN